MEDTLAYWEDQPNIQNRAGMQPTWYCGRCRLVRRRITLLSRAEGICRPCARELGQREFQQRMGL